MSLLPLDGVHDVDYVETVARALDTALAFYGKRLPSVARSLPFLHVYLSSLPVGVDGLTLETDSRPEIWLRNRYEEAAGPLVCAKIEASCAHELFHAHQWVCCPDSLGAGHFWSWWGEATATFMETLVNPGNHEFFCFLFPWMDTPGTPAHVAWRGYGSAVLCELLEERFGAGLVLQTWIMKKSKPDPDLEYPADAIDAMTGHFRIPFGSSSAQDFFGSQFSLALYFPDDVSCGFKTHGALLAKKVGRVFTTGTHELEETPLKFESKMALDGLSAEYHLIGLDGHSPEVEISIDCESDLVGADSISPVKCMVSQLDGACLPIADPVEIWPAAAGSGSKYRGSATFGLAPNAVDLLLIVANPTHGAGEMACREYSVTVRGIR
jgi:hypothetical protein